MVDFNLKPNTIIYTYESWSKVVTRASIINICTVNNQLVYNIKYLDVIDKNGHLVDKSFGSATKLASDLYYTAKECYDAIDAKNNKIINDYCKEIKTIEDLIDFPLHHCLIGEEYTDDEAVVAYKIKAKELLNIDLD